MSASPLALLAALPPAGKTSPNAANTVPQKGALHAAEVGTEATAVDDTDAPADKPSFAQLLRDQTSPGPASPDADGKADLERETSEPSEVTPESSAQLSAWLAALMKAPPQAQAQEPAQGRVPGSTAGRGTPTDLEQASKGVAQALSSGATAQGHAKTGLQKPALMAADKAAGADGKATKSAAPSLAREAAATALEASRATLSGPSPSGVAGSAATSGNAAASEALQAAKASTPRPGTGENGPSQVVLNHLATGAASASATVAASASPQATAAAAVADTFIAQDVRRPEFVPVFSARIATLVQEGIELARVHLNPVDMGPVSLQLSLDGLQVRVDMTAEVAATRQVLEQALPSLAGALREAGFTLSGGGVAPPAEAANTGGQDTRGSSGSSGESNPQASTGSNAMSGQQADGRRQAEGEPGRTPVGSSVGIAEGLATEVLLDADGTPRLAQGRGLIDTFA
jgi:flagellar hook-length control protein FliK